MQLFYAPDISGNQYTLDKEESTHCVKVLRMREGQSIFLTNGEGTFFKAKIVLADPRACFLEIEETIENYGKRPFYLHIAIAPPKNTARLEWFLEKAVEMGIDEITPLVCEHSEREKLNFDRLNKIILSAMKQSLKTYLPKLNESTKYTDFLKTDFLGQKLIAHCEGEERNPLKRVYWENEDVLIVIGPEGDFSRKEIEQSLEAGFVPITLGNSRLRTETAALYSCMAIHLLNDN